MTERGRSSKIQKLSMTSPKGIEKRNGAPLDFEVASTYHYYSEHTFRDMNLNPKCNQSRRCVKCKSNWAEKYWAVEQYLRRFHMWSIITIACVLCEIWTLTKKLTSRRCVKCRSKCAKTTLWLSSERFKPNGPLVEALNSGFGINDLGKTARDHVSLVRPSFTLWLNIWFRSIYCKVRML